MLTTRQLMSALCILQYKAKISCRVHATVAVIRRVESCTLLSFSPSLSFLPAQCRAPLHRKCKFITATGSPIADSIP